jgi:hypothetical protein
MNLREMGCGGVNVMHLAQNRSKCVNTVMKLRVP